MHIQNDLTTQTDIRICIYCSVYNVFVQFQIRTNSPGSLFIDGNNDEHASWMRHIKCAGIDTHYNLLSFQYGGMLYYFTIEDITAGSELLVWNEEEYSTQLGDLLMLCGQELVEQYGMDIVLSLCSVSVCLCMSVCMCMFSVIQTSQNFICHIVLNYDLEVYQS